MAWMDQNEIVDEELKLKLGWGIIFSNLMLIGLFAFRILFSLTKIFYQLIKMSIRILFKKNKKNKIGVVKTTEVDGLEKEKQGDKIL